MTTLELHLEDDLKDFVDRQSRESGHSSPEAYIQALLAMERIRSRANQVASLLVAAIEEDPHPRVIDEDFWSELNSQIAIDSSRKVES